MAKIVILCSECPHPISKGSHDRMDSMIRATALLGFEIHLCVLKMAPDGKSSTETENSLRDRYGARKVVVVDHPHFFAPKGTPKRKIRNFVLRRLRPIIRETISNFHTCPPSFRGAAARLCNEVAPSVLLVNYVKLAMAIPSKFKGISVVDTHDVLHLAERSLVSSGAPSTFSIERMKRNERKLLSRFDRLIAINKNEHSYLSDFLKPVDKPLFTIPAFRIDAPAPRAADDFDFDLLFVGSGASFNTDGLLALNRHVLTELSRRRPALRVGVVGAVCDAPMIKSLKVPYLDLLGYVENIDRVYARSKVVAIPILAGAGMKIKLVEALAHRKAVVCTSIGADGVAIENGVSGFIFDNWSDYCEICEKLLDDDVFRREIEANASSLFMRNHHIGGNLETISAALSAQSLGATGRNSIWA